MALTVSILEAGSWSGEVLLPIHWGTFNLALHAWARRGSG